MKSADNGPRSPRRLFRKINKDTNQEQTCADMAVDLELLQDSPHLLDSLLQMEDVLDTLDIYVFRNWLDGEVVEGPVLRRYWIDMTLLYPYNKMPDPRAALRLLKHGVRVDFKKARYETGEDGVETAVDVAEGEDDTNGLVWLVKVSVPRRLIVDINAAQLDFYDDEVDVEDVQAAQDSGMTDESGYTDPMSAPENENNEDEENPNAPPAPPAPPPPQA